MAPAWQYVGDPAVADAHGRQLGYAALSTLEGMLPPRTLLVHDETPESGAPLAVWRPRPRPLSREVSAVRVEIPVDLRAMPARAELERRWAHLEEPVRSLRLQRAAMIEALYGDQLEAQHSVWMWRIGDCALVAHPGEAYVALQLYLRRLFPGTAVVVLNHANATVDGPGWVYIPDRGAYEHDIYQVWQTPLAAGSLERIADTVADVLEHKLNVPACRDRDATAPDDVRPSPRGRGRVA